MKKFSRRAFGSCIESSECSGSASAVFLARADRLRESESFGLEKTPDAGPVHSLLPLHARGDA
jgi:hypothetical protein